MMRKYVLPAGLGLVLMFSVLLIAATPMQYRTGIKADLLDTDTLKVNHNAILAGDMDVENLEAGYITADSVTIADWIASPFGDFDSLDLGGDVIADWRSIHTLVADSVAGIASDIASDSIQAHLAEIRDTVNVVHVFGNGKGAGGTCTADTVTITGMSSGSSVVITPLNAYAAPPYVSEKGTDYFIVTIPTDTDSTIFRTHGYDYAVKP